MSRICKICNKPLPANASPYRKYHEGECYKESKRQKDRAFRKRIAEGHIPARQRNDKVPIVELIAFAGGTEQGPKEFWEAYEKATTPKPDGRRKFDDEFSYE